MNATVAGWLVGFSGSRVAMILAGVTITIAGALACLRFLRHSRASVRHLLLVSAFAVLGGLPIASALIPSIALAVPVDQTPVSALDVTTAQPRATTDQIASLVGTSDVDTSTRPADAISRTAIVAAMWAIGAACCLTPILLGVNEMRSLRRSATSWTIDGVDVLVHPSIRGPVTFGVVRPVIVMPEDAQSWPHSDLVRALIHEREHVRRWDWLSQCLARVVCAIYWFHPLVWVARRRIDLEAERACDDAVVRHEARETVDSDPTAYAEQLVMLAQRLSTSRAPILSMANPADLAARVRALLDTQQRRGRAGLVPVVVASALAALLVAAMSSLKLVASPQAISSALAPAFEVVSLRPCAPGDGVAPAGGRGGGGVAATSPGRLTIQCSTVINLINRAYVSFGNPPPINHPNTPGNNIIQGAPAWANTDKYAIEAKAEGTPDITTLNGPMLRRLLEERFQLKVHEDVKDVPALALTVAPGGLKITPIDPSSCIESTPNTAGPRVMRTTPAGAPLIYAADAGPDAKPYCTVGISPKPPNIALDVTGMAFDRVVRTLSSLILDRPVVDQTGVGGLYSFHLEFGPDENIRIPATLTPSDLPPGPSIFAAVEKQLGLKLVPTRAPQASLIVDRLERPTNEPPQTAVAQRYEAATIKPCQVEEVPSGARGAAGGTNATFSPGRFFVPCVTTEQLIYLAYASYGATDGDHLINDDPGSASNATKIRGGPAWVHSLKEKYSIEATAPGATERTVLMGSMLRSLLEDRFHLKIHRETEEVAMYELNVAKSGFKLKPMKEGDCDPDGPMRPDPAASKPRCGTLYMTSSDPGGTRWSFGTGTMASLAGQLSRSLGMHVIDRTAITDKFVFTFQFGADPNALSIETSGVSTALKDQLGLTLTTIKAPRGFIVIDAIDRPTER